MTVDFSGSFAWSELTEEQKYDVWSEHVRVREGEPHFTYPVFCDAMDEITSVA